MSSARTVRVAAVIDNGMAISSCWTQYKGICSQGSHDSMQRYIHQQQLDMIRS